jgi:hypothetical protein
MPTSLIELTAERGRIQLRLCCLQMGSDLCVTLSGGDQEHIGAVALSQPRPGHEDKGTTSATTSVITLCGHQEDELARRIASQVAVHVNAVVCVACGIHVDAILPSELNDVVEMSEILTKRLLNRLSDQKD